MQHSTLLGNSEKKQRTTDTEKCDHHTSQNVISDKIDQVLLR